MATLANIFNQFAGSKAVADAIPVAAERSDAYKLRPIPNEDVYLHFKRIDNSRVVRQPDPSARARDFKFLGAASIAAIGLIAVLLPGASNLIAGYTLSSLQQEHERLVGDRARLELEEARLVSPERLQQLADMQNFVDPAQKRTVYLPKTTDNSFARLNSR